MITHGNRPYLVNVITGALNAWRANPSQLPHRITEAAVLSSVQSVQNIFPSLTIGAVPHGYLALCYPIKSDGLRIKTFVRLSPDEWGSSIEELLPDGRRSFKIVTVSG